jgi:hypothetical protein
VSEVTYPVPEQGGKHRVRAPVPAAQDHPTAISQDTTKLIITLRKDLAEQGLDAGPHTIAWPTAPPPATAYVARPKATPGQPHHRHPQPRPHRPRRRRRQSHPPPRREAPSHRHRPDPRPDAHPGPGHPRHQRHHRRTAAPAHPRHHPQLPATGRPPGPPPGTLRTRKNPEP